MQHTFDGKQPLWKSQSPTRSPTEFLYDGLPSAAQQFLVKSTDSFQPAAKRDGTTPFRGSRNSLFGQLRRISKIKVLLVLLWLFVLWWGEALVFRRHVAHCNWKLWEQWDPGAKPHHLVLLADPQLVDPHTYPGRPWPLSTLTIRHTDQYLRRSFIALDKKLDPETVFFLGDLFDGGREWSTPNSKSPDPRWHKYGQDYWLKEYKRFGKIYFEPWRSGTAMRGRGRHRKLVANLPGNHDLGLGNGIQLSVRKRFHTFFGPGDRVDVVGNHTFVSIDAVSLSAKSQMQPVDGVRDSALWDPTEAFLTKVQATKNETIQRALRVQQRQAENALQSYEVTEIEDGADQPRWTRPVSEQTADMPTVVLSHVPFYRVQGTPCGPLRERFPPANTGQAFDPDARDDANAILVGYGHQYQNVLSEGLSREIITKIGNVKHIFSGDDHDYCEVLHKDLSGKEDGIREITVKSTSWAMGVRKPGFLLVSLWNPLETEKGASRSSNIPSIQTHLCLLPDQLAIFVRYGFLLIATLTILGARAFFISGASWRHSAALLPLPVSTPTFPPADKGTRGRADSASYVSSANSSDCNGLAVRSNAGRSRPLSPASGYGFEHGFGPPASAMNGSPLNPDYLSPFPQQPQHVSPPNLESEGKKDPYSSWSRDRWKAKSRYRASAQEFARSVVQVGFVALLWYAWLAHSV